VTELVDTLERDGLVERRTDPADRRARLVQITPAGEQARAKAVEIREQLVERVLGRLGEPERAEFATTLKLIRAEIDKIDAEGDPAGGAAGTLHAP
jgi:DNA-binding MarR family transcriptional regulator